MRCDIEPGDFIVIDQSGVNCGLMGSNNTLICLRAGARGLVCNGGVRDTDELILQKVPFWSATISHTSVQGRLQFAEMNVPVNVGGVEVHPGDVVVADGDGVVVVPAGLAEDVAAYARDEITSDKAARRGLYDDLGLPHDPTVGD